MNLDDLAQKHARELQELEQKQAAERADLERQIERVQQEVVAQTGNLARRQKEIELEKLRQSLYLLLRGHASHMAAEQARQTTERTICSLAPMVVELLEEAARMKELWVIERHSIPHEYERGVGKWIFRRKKVVKYTTTEDWSAW
jgi:hypothetical protein